MPLCADVHTSQFFCRKLWTYTAFAPFHGAVVSLAARGGQRSKAIDEVFRHWIWIAAARVPPDGFPNEDSNWSTTNSEESMDIANRLFVANRLNPALIRPKGPTRIAKQIPQANSLLAALPRKECQHLIDDLEQVALTYGEVLFEPGEQIKYVYFPNDSIVSLLTLVEQHQGLGVGLVGREGMVG